MWRRVVVAGVVLPLLAGCGSSGGAADDGRVTVVAAFYPLAEAARRVGGGAVRVDDLTPSGVEPHDIELTPDQVDELEDADVVLYVGGGFQPAVEEVAERRDATTVDLLPRGTDDPHFWLDPVEYRQALARVVDALARARPASRATFARRAATFESALAQLDADIRHALATCDRRTIITTHEAFAHFARRYGIEQHSVAGLSPEAEPNADRLAQLADVVRRTGVTTVFSESAVSEDVARTLAREAGVGSAVLSPLETRPTEGSYVSVMRENVAALVDALGCRR
jgi:zinc transport system substrate-binding protein